MAYQTFRPSSLPYRADALWPQLTSFSDPVTPTFGGDGSWSDGDDATYVSSFGASGQRTTVLAVDFAPIPDLTYDPVGWGGALPYGVTARLALMMAQADLDNNNRGNVIAKLLTRSGADMGDSGFRFEEFAPATTTYTTPTTYSTSGGWYNVFDSMYAEITANGCTMAFALQDVGGDDLSEVWRVFEFGLLFDVTAVEPPTIHGIPPLRQLQRGDGLGMSSAPRAIQNRSRQASLRNIGFM